jgi:hypothetical protein
VKTVLKLTFFLPEQIQPQRVTTMIIVDWIVDVWQTGVDAGRRHVAHLQRVVHTPPFMQSGGLGFGVAKESEVTRTSVG